MKKLFFIFLVLLHFTAAFAQPNVDSMLSTAEVGKQYLSLSLENNPSLGKSFYVIIPPIFETYIDSIPQAKENIPTSLKVDTLTYAFEIQPTAQNWMLRTIEDTLVYNYMNNRNLANNTFLLLVPFYQVPKYQTTTYYSVNNNVRNYNYNDFIPIEKQRLITAGTIKKLSSKDEILHPNQIVFEVINGKWENFKPVSIPSHPPITLIRIQEALNEKGYECKIDGIFDENTRSALQQFEKDHDLNHCTRVPSAQLFRQLGLIIF